MRQLLKELCDDHIRVKLRGFISAGRTFAATQIHVLKDAQAGKDTMDEAFLQTMIRRLLTSQVFPEDTKKDEDSTSFDDFESAQRFARLAGITLPVAIRRWTGRTLRTLESPLLGADERTHAKRALTMMMNIRWESTDFPPIDPWKAKQILDEELYGLETVKQRVIETIIQINRTHTLPSYGLLLVGPPGTGKSRLAYAVGRILKLPTAVLDMSTIRDPEALTGSPRVYINAKPGKIMEAFSRAGQSNIVFIINELDKADSDGPHGSRRQMKRTASAALFSPASRSSRFRTTRRMRNGLYLRAIPCRASCGGWAYLRPRSCSRTTRSTRSFAASGIAPAAASSSRRRSTSRATRCSASRPDRQIPSHSTPTACSASSIRGHKAHLPPPFNRLSRFPGSARGTAQAC